MCLTCEREKKSHIIKKIIKHSPNNDNIQKFNHIININVCNFCKKSQQLCTCHDIIDVTSEEIECDESEDIMALYNHMCLYFPICEKCRRGPCMCNNLSKVDILCMSCKRRPCTCHKQKICIKCKRLLCICNYQNICMKCKRKPCVCSDRQNNTLNIIRHMSNITHIPKVCVKCHENPCNCNKYHKSLSKNHSWCMKCKKKPCICNKTQYHIISHKIQNVNKIQNILPSTNNIWCMQCKKKPCICNKNNINCNTKYNVVHHTQNICTRCKKIPCTCNIIYNEKNNKKDYKCETCQRKQCICNLMNVLVCIECHKTPCYCDISLSENAY